MIVKPILSFKMIGFIKIIIHWLMELIGKEDLKVFWLVFLFMTTKQICGKLNEGLDFLNLFLFK